MSEEVKPKRQIKKLTKEEIEEYLKGSIQIPKDQWMKLHDNSQISYFKNDGGFVKSGFIKLLYTKDDEDYIRYGSKLNPSNGDRYYREFTIKLDNIKEIWKKIDQDAIIEYKLIKNNINNTLSEYTEKINVLEAKVNKLGDDIVKILKLIKKIHKLDSLDDLKNL